MLTEAGYSPKEILSRIVMAKNISREKKTTIHCKDEFGIKEE